MKKDSYFETQRSKAKTIMMMPFKVDIYTIPTKVNTSEAIDKREKEAREYLSKVFKEEMILKDYNIVRYISLDDLEKDDFDEHLFTVIDDIYDEFSDATFSLSKNLDEDHGEPLNYSVGLYAEELRDLLSQKPDLFLFIFSEGWVTDLNAFEPGIKAAMAFLTLGMYLINPAPEDTIVIRLSLVDARTGELVWYDVESYGGRSLLSYVHIKDTVKKILHKLPDAVERDEK